MTDVYCGIKNVPKGRRRGTMKECLEKGQVSYYGLNKIDKKVLEHIESKKGKNKGIGELVNERVKVKAQIQKMTTLFKKEEDKEKKKKMKAIIDSKRDILKTLNEKIKKAQK